MSAAARQVPVQLADDGDRPTWFRRVSSSILHLPAFLVVLLIRGYQRFVSPAFGPRCKYYPSCSTYAVTAIQRHGALRGSGLALWRLLRCNPWSLGGVDDVPEARHRHPSHTTSPTDVLN